MRSELEGTLAFQMRIAGLPIPLEEFKAIPGRRYRWDFAWLCPPGTRGLLVEVNGGVWAKGGHSTGKGISRDYEKANLAMLAGWRCLTVTAEHIESGQALRWIMEALTQT